MPLTSVYDRVGLDRILDKQHGVVARGQLIECGMNDRILRHLIRRQGGWQILLPGVYLTIPGTATFNQRDKAALLYAGAGSVITGTAALRRHGLQCGELDLTEVLIADEVHRKSTGFVRILRTTRMPARFRVEQGIRFTYLPRAVGDAARGMRDRRGVETLVCSAIQRTSCEVGHLIAELEEGPVSGTRLFRAALADVSDGIRSTAEADVKRLIERSDIERPLYNPCLYLPDGTFLCSSDLWWERHGVAGEVDSIAYHSSIRDYAATTRRHNRIEAHGIRVLHWLPSTIRCEGEMVIDEIRRTLASAAQHSPPNIITVPAGTKPPAHCRPPARCR